MFVKVHVASIEAVAYTRRGVAVAYKKGIVESYSGAACIVRRSSHHVDERKRFLVPICVSNYSDELSH